MGKKGFTLVLPEGKELRVVVVKGLSTNKLMPTILFYFILQNNYLF